MKISEVIKKLLELKSKHGDILCVISGFDECGIEDIGLDVTQIKNYGNSNYKYTDEVDLGVGDTMPAILFDFN